MLEARRNARIEIARLRFEDMRGFARIRARDEASPERPTVAGLRSALKLLKNRDPLRYRRFVGQVAGERLRGCDPALQAEIDRALGWLVDQPEFPLVVPQKAFERLSEPLAALDIPVLVLWGAHDRAVPVEQAWRQREIFPSAEVVVLEDSGHWPYLDDPDAVAAEVVPFLERQLVG